jgi:hypothetical protein
LPDTPAAQGKGRSGMSVLNSLLNDFGTDERAHLLGLIQKNVDADLAAVASGAALPRHHDLGSQARHSRPRGVRRATIAQ